MGKLDPREASRRCALKIQNNQKERVKICPNLIEIRVLVQETNLPKEAVI